MFLATQAEGYIACGQAVRDMDHREIFKYQGADHGDRREARCRHHARDGRIIRKNIPGASITLFDAAHIANIECGDAYTDAVLGFLQQK